MKRSGARFQRLAAVGRRSLLAAGILLALSACGRSEPSDPWSPQTPPRPVTQVSGHVTTAQLELSARPVAPPPGEM